MAQGYSLQRGRIRCREGRGDFGRGGAEGGIGAAVVAEGELWMGRCRAGGEAGMQS